MPLQQKTPTLKAIFSEVLANLAFMFTDDEPQADNSGQQWFETVIEYEGPHKGSLRLRCTRDFAVLLAANLLGIDPEDGVAQDQCDDATREFMNIVCGQFVTAMHGPDDVYNLSIPQMSELPETPDLEYSDGVNIWTVSIDGHTIQLSCELST